VAVFNICSVLMLSTYSTTGPVMTAKQNRPPDAPCLCLSTLDSTLRPHFQSYFVFRHGDLQWVLLNITTSLNMRSNR